MKPRITAKTAAPPSASSAMPLPPIVHAIVHVNFTSTKQGGSIGSALAILSFYPLERIRFEIQSQQQQKKPQKSTNRGATTKKENAFNPNQETYNQADESSKETILQCLIRLHKEKSLYRGAKNMALTLMINAYKQGNNYGGKMAVPARNDLHGMIYPSKKDPSDDLNQDRSLFLHPKPHHLSAGLTVGGAVFAENEACQCRSFAMSAEIVSSRPLCPKRNKPMA
eukprot:scaffold5998_cov122-Skeletonema_dohrnii-CCMP3373.AAC.1